MNEALKALDRREKVTLIYHGKVKGTIVPLKSGHMTTVAEHPFFNMAGEEPKIVNQQMDALRASRFKTAESPCGNEP